MTHSLPSAVAHPFEEMAASQRRLWHEQPAGRPRQAAAILEWSWWLSRQFPPGLASLSLYRADRISLTLLASGQLRLVNGLATSMIGGAIVTSAHDLERALHGEHLDALSESILSGAIWARLRQTLAR